MFLTLAFTFCDILACFPACAHVLGAEVLQIYRYFLEVPVFGGFGILVSEYAAEGIEGCG
jgi:hypothetical protein